MSLQLKSTIKITRQILIVIHTGLEPVTSALSRQRSKPTELMDQEDCKYANISALSILLSN